MDSSVQLRAGDAVRLLREDGSPGERGAVVKRNGPDTYAVERENGGADIYGGRLTVERSRLQLEPRP